MTTRAGTPADAAEIARIYCVIVERLLGEAAGG